MHTTATTPAHGYTVNAIKTFTGMEGHGFNANLLRDGVKVAEVIDDASGGPVSIHWLDERKGERVQAQYRNYKDEILTRAMSPEEAKLHAYLIRQPAAPAGFKGDDGKEVMMFPSDEIFVSDLVNSELERREVERKVKSWLKNKIVYIKEGGLFTTKPIQPAQIMGMLARYKEKYPDFVYLNDKPLSEAIALATPALLGR